VIVVRPRHSGRSSRAAHGCGRLLGFAPRRNRAREYVCRIWIIRVVISQRDDDEAARAPSRISAGSARRGVVSGTFIFSRIPNAPTIRAIAPSSSSAVPAGLCPVSAARNRTQTPQRSKPSARAPLVNPLAAFGRSHIRSSRHGPSDQISLV